MSLNPKDDSGAVQGDLLSEDITIPSNNLFWRIINSVQQNTLWPNKLRTSFLVRIGNVKMDKTSRIAEKVFIGSNKLIMGKETFINTGSFLDGNAPVVIEDYARCGPYVKILTGTHKYRFSVIRRRSEDGTISKSVTVKKGAWVGMGSIILPGVTISEGCIIAAGSVVNKDTSPNGLYAGNPAKRVKDLPITEDLKHPTE